MNLDSFAYVHSGRFTSRGEWIHPERVIDTTELIIVTDGSFTLAEDGSVYSMKPGQTLILEPGRLHRGIEPTNERVSFYWIHFNTADAIPFKCFALKDVYPVSLLCRQLNNYASRGFGRAVTDGLLRTLLAEISSQYTGDEAEGAIVAKITEWIRINSDRALTVSDLAERFGYSDDYISRLLKSHTGRGFKTLVSEYRLNYVKRLLLETELTLTEIADRAGFPDCKLFLKFFKYHEGITPTEFRSVFTSQHTNNH